VRILTINTGSSSLKAALYGAAPDRLELLVGMTVERIGRDGSRLIANGGGDDGSVVADERRAVADHPAALRWVLDWLAGAGTAVAPDAVGHRVVHGGPDLFDPTVVTPAVRERLLAAEPLAPNHLSQAIAAIDACAAAFPGTPQVACFDTAFHRTLPVEARLLPLPRDLAEAGVVRYGFHGLSCESIVGQLRELGPLPPRLVIAHLGNGASLTAVRDGASVETTMGFTPAGGLVMGTRSGDLDPGVVVWLLRERGLDADALEDLVTRRAGLAGLAGAADMRDLLAREAEDRDAAEAVAVFCHHARKLLGAMVAVLGGLDALVFTGGIGEHAWQIRERICAGFGFAGIALDPERNRAHAPVVSTADEGVVVRVLRTDEDREIARHVGRLLTDTSTSTSTNANTYTYTEGTDVSL
jgi:acetate kinase